jgi:L-threonylcarbamoyladenylate synthase
MAGIWQWREDGARDLWQAARGHLLAGEVLALPTDTFYALSAHAFLEGGLARLFTLKGRPPDQPALLLVSGPDMAASVAQHIDSRAYDLMAKFWPGPLTLILPARPGLSPKLTGGTVGVGLRQPRQDVTCRLIAALGFPVTGTSANRTGQAPFTRAEEVARQFAGAIPFILDAGPCPGGLPSTIVDLNSVPPRLIRAGAVAVADIVKIIPDLVVER